LLKRVRSTFYWSPDLDRSVGFYRDVLGMDLVSRYEDDWAEFDIGGDRLALHGSRGAAPPVNGATVVFEVEDLDTAMNALIGKGVIFDGDVVEIPEGGGRFASFRDPAGNLLQILEPPQGAP